MHFSVWFVIAAFGPPMLGAAITSGMLWWIARRYTARLAREKKEADDALKQFESTLEFSRRFQDLLQQQRDLNRTYDAVREKEGKDFPPTTAEKEDGRMWWWRFFDLILYEYELFLSGFIREDRFVEWMKWRWHEYNPQADEKSITSGVDYGEGWTWWKTRKAHDENRLIRFLDEVHDAKTPEHVPGIVGTAYDRDKPS